MTGSDLILLAPWIAFGVGLAVVLLRLHLLRRRRRRRPGDSPGEYGTPESQLPCRELRDSGERL
jgi:hypothetical protein